MGKKEWLGLISDTTIALFIIITGFVVTILGWSDWFVLFLDAVLAFLLMRILKREENREKEGIDKAAILLGAFIMCSAFSALVIASIRYDFSLFLMWVCLLLAVHSNLTFSTKKIKE